LTIWPSEHLTIWPFDHLTIWPSEHLTIWSFDHLTIWPFDHLTHLSHCNLGSILVICLFQFNVYIIFWFKYGFHVVCRFEVSQTKLLLQLLFLPYFMHINFIRSCQYFTNTCELSDNNPHKATFISYTIHHNTNVIWMCKSSTPPAMQ
jgi:hypothetical protein